MSWPMVALGDIFEIARGGSPRPISEYITTAEDGLNWIKIGDATASSKFIHKTKEKIRPEGLKKTRQVKPGDFLLTNSMSFGRPYIMATDGCIHDGWLVLKPRADNFDADYFYHLLSSDDVFATFSGRAGGSTVKNLNSEIVASVEIPLPPLDEQKRIAGILDRADALRRKRRDALALLDTLTQSIFVEMFGDYERPMEQWNYTTEEIGSITIKVTDGTHQAPNWSESGIPFIFSSNIRSQRISLETQKFISEIEYQRLTKSTKVDVGDVLYTAVGSYGNAAVVQDGPRFLFQRHIAHLKPDTAAVLPEFLSYALETPPLRRWADKVAKGVAQKTVTLTELKKMRIPVPPLETQTEFVEIIERLDLLRTAKFAADINLDSLFASLQSRAFSGKL